MIKNISYLFCSALIFTSIYVEPVHAEQAGVSGAAERIESADRLRTLSQEVASSVCHFHNGIEVDASIRMLRDSIDEFDARLLALRVGDPEHGIFGAETRKKTLRDISAIEAEWAEVRDAAERLFSDADHSEAMAILYRDADHVLEATTALLSELVTEYANPFELLASDVVLLDIVGQQAMHAQRIAYEACTLWSQDPNDSHVEDLALIVEQFDTALHALHDGMPALDVPSAPTPEIATALDDALEGWNVAREITNRLLAGNEIADDEKALLFHLMDDKMHKMEELTHLYTVYAKRVIH